MGSRKNNSTEKLDFSKRSFTDQDLDSLPLRDVTYPYREVDFSQNYLSAESLSKVLALCKLCTGLRVLKLYKNGIRDSGARELAAFLKQSSTLEEVHLSHNHFSAQGVSELVEAAEQSHVTGSKPIWLRLEHNDVEDPQTVLQTLQQCFSVCGRNDQVRCSVRVCGDGCKVHLPFFRFQRHTTDLENWPATSWEEHSDWQEDEWRCSHGADVMSGYQRRDWSRGRNHGSWDNGPWEHSERQEDEWKCSYGTDHVPSSYQRRDLSQGRKKGFWEHSSRQEDKWRSSDGTGGEPSSYQRRDWSQGRKNGSWSQEDKSLHSSDKPHEPTRILTHHFQHTSRPQHDHKITRPGKSRGGEPCGGLFVRAVGEVVGLPEDVARRSRSPPRGEALLPAPVQNRVARMTACAHEGWKEHKEQIHSPTLQPASRMRESGDYRSNGKQLEAAGTTYQVMRRALDGVSRDKVAEQSDTQHQPRTRIRVSNIPPNLTAQDIAEAFQDEAGKVRLCELLDGIALIEFFHAEDAAKAASFNEGELNGNVICAVLEP